MRSNDRRHAARPQQEAPTVRLSNGIGHFLTDLSAVGIDNTVLADASAEYDL